MNIKIDSRCMLSVESEAQVLRAIMFAVFEDYILNTTAEDFASRFGTRGTQCLAWYTKGHGYVCYDSAS